MAINVTNKQECCGCAACMNVCPQNCISMEIDKEGFFYPKIDKLNCISCDKCKRVCPVINNPNTKIETNSKVYAGRSIDSATRQASSSGGIAYLLSKKYLLEDHIVCGVRMSDDYSHAEHDCITNIEELFKLTGSKYLQSNTNKIYDQIDEYLRQGKKVLFIGTLCQVAAMRNYFSNYNHLIDYVDVVCHGVPSQFLWDKYLSYLKQQYKNEISSINFRDKSKGWEQYQLCVTFKSGKTIHINRTRGFLGLYLKNVCLRPTCGACKHKGYNRCSDLTIGDFWGIEQVLPDYDKKNGVSLIIVNSNKGEEMLNSISGEAEIEETDCKDLFQKRNKTLIRSVQISDKRDEFMEDLQVLSFPTLEKKYLDNGFITEIKRLIRRLVHA